MGFFKKRASPPSKTESVLDHMGRATSAELIGALRSGRYDWTDHELVTLTIEGSDRLDPQDKPKHDYLKPEEIPKLKQMILAKSLEEKLQEQDASRRRSQDNAEKDGIERWLRDNDLS